MLHFRHDGNYSFVVLAIQNSLSLALVTAPTLLYRTVVYYLFAAPCLLRDKSSTEETEYENSRRLDAILARVGHIYSFVWTSTLLCAGIYLWILFLRNPNFDFTGWAFGIFQIYGFWFCSVILTMFNPYRCFSRVMYYPNALLCVLTVGVVPNFFGRWHIERAYVQDVIRNRVNERGENEFFLPVWIPKIAVVVRPSYKGAL